MTLREKINVISDFISTIPINEFYPSYVIWGTLPLQKVNSDSLCSINFYGNSICNVPNGYDPLSCKITFNENGINCIKDDNSYNKCFNCKQDDNECEDPINKVNLSKIKENKNTKTHVFTSHQDLRKYDDNIMKIQLNYNIE